MMPGSEVYSINKLRGLPLLSVEYASYASRAAVQRLPRCAAQYSSRDADLGCEPTPSSRSITVFEGRDRLRKQTAVPPPFAGSRCDIIVCTESRNTKPQRTSGNASKATDTAPTRNSSLVSYRCQTNKAQHNWIWQQTRTLRTGSRLELEEQALVEGRAAHHRHDLPEQLHLSRAGKQSGKKGATSRPCCSHITPHNQATRATYREHPLQCSKTEAGGLDSLNDCSDGFSATRRRNQDQRAKQTQKART
jgi:hypothetical protein